MRRIKIESCLATRGFPRAIQSPQNADAIKRLHLTRFLTPNKALTYINPINECSSKCYAIKCNATNSRRRLTATTSVCTYRRNAAAQELRSGKVCRLTQLQAGTTENASIGALCTQSVIRLSEKNGKT